MGRNEPQGIKQTTAFSLTELLTVLGILAILAAILFPVFFAVRENGRRAVCVSNLRQIGHAFSMYVTDNDGLFPGAVIGSTRLNRTKLRGQIWTVCLLPYASKKYLTCPDRELPGAFTKVAEAPDSSFQDTLTGYAMNYRISEEIPITTRIGAFRVSGKAENLFRYPALSIMVFDARTGMAAMNYPDVDWALFPHQLEDKWRSSNPHEWGLDGYDAEMEAQSGAATRHKGGANYAFADGHVKWLNPEQLSPSPQSDGVHPGFGL